MKVNSLGSRSIHLEPNADEILLSAQLEGVIHTLNLPCTTVRESLKKRGCVKRFRFLIPCFAAALIFIATADAVCSRARLSRTTRVTDAPERDIDAVRRGAVLVLCCMLDNH